jgi:hypothetical protein
MNQLEWERHERMRLVYLRECVLRETALSEALAARKAGKKVPAGRRYRDAGSWRALRRILGPNSTGLR